MRKVVKFRGSREYAKLATTLISAGSLHLMFRSNWSCSTGMQRGLTASDLDSRRETDGTHEGMWASMPWMWQVSLQKRVILHAAAVSRV